MSNYRSDAARAWRGWYQLKRWKELRAKRLRSDPLCAFCLKSGDVRQATVCDHIKEHKGDQELFWDYLNTQSLCKPCHDASKRQIELGGYSSAADLSGYPIDAQHPANKRR